jgi:hypothetical protein
MDKNKAYQSLVSPKVLSGGRPSVIQSIETKVTSNPMPITENKCVVFSNVLFLLNSDSIAKIKNNDEL